MQHKPEHPGFPASQVLQWMRDFRAMREQEVRWVQGKGGSVCVVVRKQKGPR